MTQPHSTQPKQIDKQSKQKKETATMLGSPCCPGASQVRRLALVVLFVSFERRGCVLFLEFFDAEHIRRRNKGKQEMKTKVKTKKNQKSKKKPD
jgi:hypothetical protein